MRLAAILLVPRHSGCFHFDDATVFKKFRPNFQPPKGRIKSFYPGEGVGVVLVFEESKIDKILMKTNYFYYFPSSRHLLTVLTALHKSDELTEELLKKQKEDQREERNENG